MNNLRPERTDFVDDPPCSLSIKKVKFKLYHYMFNSMAYGTWRFNIAFTRALNNPYPEPNQLNSIYLKSILIVSSHQYQGLPKGLFHIRLLVKILKGLLPSTMAYGTRRFIVAFTRALNNPYPEPNQSNSIYLKSILILSSHFLKVSFI